MSLRLCSKMSNTMQFAKEEDEEWKMEMLIKCTSLARIIVNKQNHDYL